MVSAWGWSNTRAGSTFLAHNRCSRSTLAGIGVVDAPVAFDLPSAAEGHVVRFRVESLPIAAASGALRRESVGFRGVLLGDLVPRFGWTTETVAAQRSATPCASRRSILAVRLPWAVTAPGWRRRQSVNSQP